MKKLLIILLFFLLFLSSCFLLVDYKFNYVAIHLPKDTKLQRTFIKNTLSYPIYVESYFVSLTNKNIEDNILINTNLSLYRDIIEIAPGDIKQVMDYIEPDQLKIYSKTSDSSLKLITDKYGDYYLLHLEDLFSEEFYNQSVLNTASIYIYFPTAEDLLKIPPIDDLKYKKDVLPWRDYLIGSTLYFNSPLSSDDGLSLHYERENEMDIDKTVHIRELEYRKNSLEDKPVKDVFIKLNPEHENFKLK